MIEYFSTNRRIDRSSIRHSQKPPSIKKHHLMANQTKSHVHLGHHSARSRYPNSANPPITTTWASDTRSFDSSRIPNEPGTQAHETAAALEFDAPRPRECASLHARAIL